MRILNVSAVRRWRFQVVRRMVKGPLGKMWRVITFGQ